MKWIKISRTKRIPLGPVWITDGHIVDIWFDEKNCPIPIRSITHYIIFTGDIPKLPKSKKDRDEDARFIPLSN